MSRTRKLSSYLLSFAVISNSIALDTLRVGMSLGPTFHETKPKNFNGYELNSFVRKSPFVGVFAGYDHLVQETPLFVGLEAEAANHSAERTNEVYNATNTSFKLATNNSFLGAVRVGVSLGEALIYGKVGLSLTNWKTTISSPGEYIQKDYKKYGNAFGGGMECSVNKNCSLGIEHIFTSVNSIKRIHPDNALTLSPTIMATKLRLVYNF